MAQPNLLVVAGRQPKDADERAYLYRGIASRDFERRFELADHVVVTAAGYADGVLTIDLAREVPEALKPRRIEIIQGPGAERLESRGRQRRAA